MSRTAHERMTQICFETLNVTGLAIFERPLLQLYAANTNSGLVIDIGYDSTDITPIVEDEIVRNSIINVPVGIHHCELYLAHLLRRNSNIMYALNTPHQLSPSDLDAAILTLIRKAWSEGIISPPLSEGAPLPPLSQQEANAADEGVVDDIAAILVAGKEKALIEAANAKKNVTAQAKKAAATAAEKERAALDLVDVEFTFKPRSTPGVDVAGEELDFKVTLGKERHQLCEPLFDPALLNRLGEILDSKSKARLAETPLGVQDAVKLALDGIDLTQRPAVWGGVLLTGDASVKGKTPHFLNQLWQTFLES